MKEKTFVMDKEFINDCITLIFTFKKLLAKIDEMDCDKVKMTAKDAISISDLRLMLAEKCSLGYKDAVRCLLGKYNAEKLSDVPKEKYPELIKDISLIGKNIL